ncbi:isocitrate lyase/PEP mutase family protein [Nocardia crassostreae]|uniref:isocitrate lyase/PEP mutase family protein n=1 Tax=Nocardia crassostreae TaxID=53428 RepID=UPI000829B6EB|nr:isocitrate lyase/phosphoenolpyruvate mutase family protein [Nocardia crassostreae]
MTLKEKAEVFLGLHKPGDPVILPTVWDAWSAKLVQEGGFAAITVGSHPLADSVGKGDGEGMDFADVTRRVREITAAVDIPVSVDLESGYGLKPGDLIEGLLEAGAVGFNIEDTVHREGKRLRAPQEHADLIAELRQAADGTGVHVVINARTDVIMRPDVTGDKIEEALSRLRLCATAGADVLYPVGVHNAETQRRLCSELPLPVNAIDFPEKASRAQYAELGAARVSFGPFLQRALTTEATRLFEAWR